MSRRLTCLGNVLTFLLVCTLVFTMLPAAFAQETTAGVQGYVKDASGAVIVGATVEISGPALIGTNKTQSDSSGFYRFTGLPPGNYTLTASAAGFRVVKRGGISLESGRLPNIDIPLEIGTASEVIEVHGESPVVDVTQSKVAVTLTETDLMNIPKGRSFQSMIPFAPGARQEPLQSARGTRTSGFQIDGASDGENVYLINGINTTDANVGGSGKNFQSDFIQEVQVKSSSFEAEYGGAIGGVVNAVSKRGAANWHGELKAYYQSDKLDANDPCASGFTSSIGGSLVCGLRLNPTLAGLSTGTRQDGTPEYYIPKKDDRTVIEPGYEIGGPILKERLWLFSSYIPQIDTTNRTTTFTGKNPGPRRLTNTFLQHNMFNRLDFRAVSSLRLFADWNYAYSRTQGQLGAPDSAYGQVNTGASTDPSTFRSDSGTVNPLSVYSFGGDWTPTTKLVVTSRFGYFFRNNESRGVPTGTRYIYDNTVNASSVDLAGVPYPTGTPFNTVGFSNIPNNFSTHFDVYKRKSFNIDASYFVGHLLGAHTFKGGYFWSTQANDVLLTANGNVVDLVWGSAYSPLTSTTVCNPIKDQNAADPTFGVSVCGGKYGYFFVGSTTVSNTGGTTQTAQAVYLQDAWTVGRRLTLNLGVRFDTESLPAYDPKRFPSLDFGWGQKVAPRLGAAYDLLGNGKIKVYGSYGKFYDIMKMNLARGSFGSDYWHECVYALDSTDYTTITPTLQSLAGCPASGPAPGVAAGRFIENVDFRATKADPRDPAIDTHMKPMAGHEFVAGVDWAIRPTWSLETRYSRKRLDNAIEDMAITDNLGFYIGNPGSTISDVLHRNVVIPGGNNFGPPCTAPGVPAGCDPNYNSDGYLLTTANGGPFCAECPGTIAAHRRYDGAEFRLTHRGGGKWYASFSYTYSKLRGNYPGLTNTDPTDGNGGRHNPNNTRLFDIPTMTYLPNGKIDDGPLSTDRPNTFKAYGYYTLRWFGMVTNFGLTQSIFQGTPINTCLPVVGTSSACEWATGRNSEVIFTRTPGDYQPKPQCLAIGPGCPAIQPLPQCLTCGDFVVSKTTNDARTPAYLQTDFQLSHRFNVSKSHENYGLVFEANVYNLFNQHSAVAYNENVNGSGGELINPTRAARFSGDPQTDWAIVMKPYNYADALNGEGAFAGIQSPMTMASRYRMANVFQTARQLRLAIRFTF